MQPLDVSSVARLQNRAEARCAHACCRQSNSVQVIVGKGRKCQFLDSLIISSDDT